MTPGDTASAVTIVLTSLSSNKGGGNIVLLFVPKK